jgi:hypothetical protein
MALTITRNAPDYTSSRVHRVVTITGPSSYSTGGETLTAAMLGLSRLDALIFSGCVSDGANGIRFVTHDLTNGKLQWFEAEGTAVPECDNGEDQSAFTFKALAIGA